MKDSKEYAKKIAKLYRGMKKEYAKVKAVEYEDPIEAIVFGILCEYQPLPAARTSLRRIKKHFVDLNDLRVSRGEEVVAVLGKDGDDIKTIANDICPQRTGSGEGFKDTGRAKITKEIKMFPQRKKCSPFRLLLWRKTFPFGASHRTKKDGITFFTEGKGGGRKCFATVVNGSAADISKFVFKGKFIYLCGCIQNFNRLRHDLGSNSIAWEYCNFTQSNPSPFLNEFY